MIAGTETCASRNRVEGRHDGRPLGVVADLVVDALIQPQARGQPPGELREELVLLVLPRQRRVGAGLAVVVAQVLVSGEEPQAIARHRAAEGRGEVLEPGPLVAAHRLARTQIGELHGMTGEAGELRMGGRLEPQLLAPVPGDHVDHGALHVAEFGRGADGLDVHFLDEADARFRSCNPVARAGEVRAVEQELVLVGARSERRHRGDHAARRRGGRDPGSGPDHVEHARSPRRNSAQILGPESGPDTRVPGVEVSAGALDGHRHRQARHRQYRGSLDGGAGGDEDAWFAQGRKPRHVDLEHVPPGRQGRESQLSPVVGGQRGRAADERGRRDTDSGPGHGTALGIPYSADEDAGQALRGWSPRQQEAGPDGQEHEGPSSPVRWPWCSPPHGTLLGTTEDDHSNTDAKRPTGPMPRKRETGAKP